MNDNEVKVELDEDTKTEYVEQLKNEIETLKSKLSEVETQNEQYVERISKLKETNSRLLMQTNVTNEPTKAKPSFLDIAKEAFSNRKIKEWY